MNFTKRIFRKWTAIDLLTKLIAINAAVFLTLGVAGIVASLSGGNINRMVDWLALPSAPMQLLSHPWTIVTYMFTQYDVWHILFNMLTLFWFGRLFCYRCTPRQLVALYIYGGITGGALYVAAAQLFPAIAGTLVGASASVMAIVIAIAILMPDHEIYMLLFGGVKLKWVAIGAVAIFAIGLVGQNAGGHVAHLGGIGAGLLFGLMMKRGVDITKPLNRLIDSIADALKNAKPKRRKKISRRPERQTEINPEPYSEARLDTILDKIKKSGYSSLTSDEKRFLFNASRRK